MQHPSEVVLVSASYRGWSIIRRLWRRGFPAGAAQVCRRHLRKQLVHLHQRGDQLIDVVLAVVDRERRACRGGHVEAFHQRHRAVMAGSRSEEHTSELQSLMRISYAVFCLKKKTKI